MEGRHLRDLAGAKAVQAHVARLPRRHHGLRAFRRHPIARKGPWVAAGVSGGCPRILGPHAPGRRSPPKTLSRRISSLSSFHRYLRGAAGKPRLPITVPNPAHAQFISRGSADAREETRALSVILARQPMSLPSGESLPEYRDRAILKTFICSGIRQRLPTESRDFHLEDGEATLRLHEKGGKRMRASTRPIRCAPRLPRCCWTATPT